MKTRLILLALCLVATITSVAQNTSGIFVNPAVCSPAGTWYGGGEAKYLLTIVPAGQDTFTLNAQVVMALSYAGLAGWTTWSGELRKVKANYYVGHYVSLYTNSNAIPPDAGAYEMDAARGWLKFSNCNNFEIDYDFYGVYFDLTKVPFVDTPDFNAGGGAVEHYTRMPSQCPVCGLMPKPLAANSAKH